MKSTHLRVSITSVIWQPQSDRENPDGLQIFARNALEFTWCNQSKNFWTSFTKSKRFQWHMRWLKCSLLTFNEDYLKKLAFWFFFLATWVNIAALLYVKEAKDRGFVCNKEVKTIKWQINCVIAKTECKYFDVFKSYFPYLDNDLYIIIKLHALLIQLFFYFSGWIWGIILLGGGLFKGLF